MSELEEFFHDGNEYDSYENDELFEDNLDLYKREQDIKDNAINIVLLFQDYCYKNGFNMCEKLSANDILTLIDFN